MPKTIFNKVAKLTDSLELPLLILFLYVIIYNDIYKVDGPNPYTEGKVKSHFEQSNILDGIDVS